MTSLVRFPDLVTPRLCLGQPQRSDADSVIRVLGDPEVLRYYNVDRVTRRDEALSIIEARRRRNDTGYGIRWAIRLRETGEYIGSCGFEVWHRVWHYGEIGYELGRAHWRQGYMTEALRSIIGYGFERMELHRIEAQVVPANAASCGLLLKLGFRQEGVARQRGYWHGEYHDLAQFGLLRDDLTPLH